MNTISLSQCGNWIELWHNGAVIAQRHILQQSLFESVAQLRKHIKEWAGDENPTISSELADKMKKADSNLQRMAFGNEWR